MIDYSQCRAILIHKFWDGSISFDPPLLSIPIKLKTGELYYYANRDFMVMVSNHPNYSLARDVSPRGYQLAWANRSRDYYLLQFPWLMWANPNYCTPLK